MASDSDRSKTQLLSENGSNNLQAKVQEIPSNIWSSQQMPTSTPFSALRTPWLSPPSPVDDNGDLYLFPPDWFHRKRKAPSFSENSRPPKVLITEAVVKDLDSLHLDAPQVTFDSGDVSLDDSTKPKTWAEFHATELMEVDEPANSRRVTPQLEMSESLKEAIRLADQAEENGLLPESVIEKIVNPVPRPICMALVPYCPPKTLWDEQTSKENADRKSHEIDMEE